MKKAFRQVRSVHLCNPSAAARITTRMRTSIQIARIVLPPILIVAILITPVSSHTNARPMQAANNTPGSEACSSCHSEIYKSYIKTVMARASGPAVNGGITGEFDDKISGVRYRIYEQNGHVWMSYQRGSELNGVRELLYFIGSGEKGRTYLFSDDGYLFEAPINWYTREKRWNMAPAYIESRDIPMNLPSYSSCLNCHTSGLQPRVPGTRNKFSGRPFLHDGITCERCHGTGDGHVSGKGPIVNPAKLAPDRRDSICMECHFEGTVAVQLPGKHLYQFQAGDRLSDYVHYFVLGKNEADRAEALSQFEALSLSQCKRKSGDRMWCGSCHDPHQEPAETDKAAYYRGKCLNCHGDGFAAKHHANQPDCRQCHMPSLPSADVAHTQSTDHRILSNPRLPQLITRVSGPTLEVFPQSESAQVSTRDRALGWYQLAQRGVQDAAPEADIHLQKAVKEQPDDPDVLSALAFMDQRQGREKDARELYGKVVKIKPRSNTAATNLGILDARAGDLRDAVQLWQGAFARVPYRSEIGMDLAMVFCADGQKDIARKYLERVLEFNPDYSKARQLLGHLKENSGQCKP